eukprot:CAMPEP_0113945104 /NCGR_PEP_ID=MMETSP1339-20121228/38486_1 /TAXON_ID=94617 /ORGANISM="Fibrocapsa japonica" /LENGTH=387 /DNA_ID=CAMNT_0000950513 /DNA_START=64 /DNA_END=1224 /DNA_ORIENTATION=- /assembly_acc=CAM_ASM_000762
MKLNIILSLFTVLSVPTAGFQSNFRIHLKEWSLCSSRKSVESLQVDSHQSDVQTFVVGKKDDDWPLDIVLTRQYPEKSRRFFRKIIQAGRVKVDEKEVKRLSKIRKGQLVSAQFKPDEKPSMEPEDLGLEVLFEDEHLIAVAKPPGMIVHPVESCETGTVLHGVLHLLTTPREKVTPKETAAQPEGNQENAQEEDTKVERKPEKNAKKGGPDPWDPAKPLKLTARLCTGLAQGVVHRLDSDTSGVVLVAKNAPAARGMAKQFQQRSVKKKYMAVVVGDLGPGVHHLTLPLLRTSSGKMAVFQEAQPEWGEEMAGGDMLTGDFTDVGEADAKGARGATTIVRRLATDGQLSVVGAEILTGRMHQLRVHLAQEANCPVLGDPVYGDTDW